MCSAVNRFSFCWLCVLLIFAKPVFSQADVSFEVKGNNNEIYNNQSVTYSMDVDVLICADNTLSGGSEIKSINAFVDLAVWCTRYLDAETDLPDSTKEVLYTYLYEIKNSNDETTTLRLINETLSFLHRLYQQHRHRLSVTEIDVFHQKYDELRSFRILNCLGDRFRLKKSDLSNVKYLETDSPEPKEDTLDFELFQMSDGVRMVRMNGRYGYTENDSTFSVAPIFSTAYPFSDGLALVGNHIETWFINKKGTPVLTLTARRYIKIWPFREGYARVQKENQLYNFIDASGKEIFAYDFNFADDFSHGMAAVCVNPFGFYNKIKSLKPLHKKELSYLAKVWGDTALGMTFGIRCGYIDPARFFRIPPIYRHAFSFTPEGRAPVYGNKSYEFLIDSTENLLMYTFQYYSHLIDTNGVPCSANYKCIEPFEEDLLLVECDETHYGVFSPAGILLGNCFYGKPVWAGHFLVYADGVTRAYGIMSKNGIIIVPPEYEEIRFLNNSQFELKKQGYITTVYISPDFKLNKIKQRKTGEETKQ